MAHRRSSIKKIRIDKRRRERNIWVMSELKTTARKVKTLMAEKKSDEAAKEAKNLFSKLDKAVKKGIIHKNRASRTHSRISRHLSLLKPASHKTPE